MLLLSFVAIYLLHLILRFLHSGRETSISERISVPPEILENLSAEAAQRLQNLVESSHRLQELAYEERGK